MSKKQREERNRHRFILVHPSVEQGALMSLNSSGMHEDPCCWLCVSRSS